jgi:hypothetical protein
MGFIRSACLSLLVLGVACVSPTPLETDASLVKRASTYWYENIAHQGIAPFAPSGYAVYRNVKDFDPKGTCYRFIPALLSKRRKPSSPSYFNHINVYDSFHCDHSTIATFRYKLEFQRLLH